MKTTFGSFWELQTIRIKNLIATEREFCFMSLFSVFTLIFVCIFYTAMM